MDDSTGWREPTARIPLRWGGYRGRYVAAVALILGGALVVQAGSAYAEYLLVGGLAAHIAGWLVLPARGSRRAAIALPSALLVGSLLLGSIATVLLAGVLAMWFYLRQRPALSYLATLPPIASGLILAQAYPQYGDGAIVVAVSLVVIVGSAWIGRSIAGSRRVF